jgi:hypothetical protein
VITADNYKDFSKDWNQKFDAAFSAAKKEDKTLDKSRFQYDEPYAYAYTDVILSNLVKTAETYLDRIEAFEEYTDENGKLVTFADFMAALNEEFVKEKAYQAFCNLNNPESPLSQYNTWYNAVGPK